MWLTLAWLGVVAGLAAFVFGRRGRVIDNHPVCRRCAFDLVGLTSSDGSLPSEQRCSECGAEVGAARGVRAVRIGNRRRRAGWMRTGLATLVTCGVLAAALTCVAVSGTKLLPWLPAWAVLQQAKSGSEAERAAAFSELDRRVKANIGVERIVEGALHMQAAEETAGIAGGGQSKWDERFGELIEEAQRAGTIGSAQWERYLAGSIHPSVQISRRIQHGRGPLAKVEYTFHLAGPASPSPRFYLNTQLTLRVDGRQYTSDGTPTPVYPLGGHVTAIIRVPETLTTNLTPGVKRLEIEFRWELRGLAALAGVGRGKHVQYLDVLILPPGELAVRQIAPSNMRAEVERRVTITSVRKAPEGGYAVELEAAEPPVDIAFDVFVLEAGGAEMGVGPWALAKGRNGAAFVGLGGTGTVDAGKEVEVILRPSVPVAEGAMVIEEIWGNEIRKKTKLSR
jgi:hypothetical protein